MPEPTLDHKQRIFHRQRPRKNASATTTTEDLAMRMQQALEARMKVVNARATEVLPKPQPKQVSEPLVSAEDMAKPFARLDTDRFRRF